MSTGSTQPFRPAGTLTLAAGTSAVNGGSAGAAQGRGCH